MTLQARTKKIISLIAVVVLLVAGGLAAVVWKLVDSADPKLPTVTAFAHGTSVTVEPTQHCNLYLEECVENPLGKLDVPAGFPLQLSLPSEISDAPWRLIVVYGDPKTGETFVDGRLFTPGEQRAVTVPSDPAIQLLGVEIQLPSAVQDETGTAIAHAVWAIQTY
ncbi:DUF2771 domain-containing protein [Rhodococcus zopfii]|uniref:DUF2771 domain-containing protein n=1 Tax=Rhodococcus zopfii TaxID=43772 RepID=UPI00093408EC|nr:DUF2771 family protein [Rhodococcus zopfii]